MFPLSIAPAKGKRGRPANKEPKEPKAPKAPRAKPGPKPKKAKEDKDAPPAEGQEKIDETFKKVRRKVDRFKGMSEEEVMKKTLPDILIPNLDYVIVSLHDFCQEKLLELKCFKSSLCRKRFK